MSYQWFHLVAGMVNLIFGVLGGISALKALVALKRSPEMWLTQRKIWLPILTGSTFFIGCGIFHFFAGTFSSSEMDLLHESFSIIGLSFVVIGVVRYARLQKGYYELKQEAIQKAKSQ